MRSFFFKILFFFFIVSSAFAQNEINQLDANGMRHGLWQKNYDGSKQLRYEGTFEHGKEVGEFKYYCEECGIQPTVIITFNKRDNTSEVKYYTIKGKLVSEGKMVDKKRSGEWLYYHENSSEIMTRENYVNGILDGQKNTYYSNGKITEESSYKKGALEGENNYYSPEGVLIKKLKYRNDQLQGEAFYYDAFGNVVIEGFYKDGRKHGLWKYYKDGKIELEETYPKPEHKGY